MNRFRSIFSEFKYTGDPLITPASSPIASVLNKLIPFLLLIILMLPFRLSAQSERSLIREGNEQYETKKFSEAEKNYRQSLEKNKNSVAGKYNLGNALYKQDKIDEAGNQYRSLLSDEKLSRENKARTYHNLGNSLLKASKFEESIEAYKNSLRLNPSDNDTRYNLAYAKAKLQQQQQQQKQDNKDNKDNKDKQQQDQQNKDQQDKEKGEQQQDQEQNAQQGDEKEEQKSAQRNKNEISREDAEKILQALNNDEKQLQKKLTKKDAVRISIDKKW